jgi:hypothetical protein
LEIKKRDILKAAIVKNLSVKKSIANATSKELTVLIFANVMSAKTLMERNLTHLR